MYVYIYIYATQTHKCSFGREGPHNFATKKWVPLEGKVPARKGAAETADSAMKNIMLVRKDGYHDTHAGALAST